MQPEVAPLRIRDQLTSLCVCVCTCVCVRQGGRSLCHTLLVASCLYLSADFETELLQPPFNLHNWAAPLESAGALHNWVSPHADSGGLLGVIGFCYVVNSSTISEE